MRIQRVASFIHTTTVYAPTLSHTIMSTMECHRFDLIMEVNLQGRTRVARAPAVHFVLCEIALYGSH